MEGGCCNKDDRGILGMRNGKPSRTEPCIRVDAVGGNYSSHTF